MRRPDDAESPVTDRIASAKTSTASQAERELADACRQGHLAAFEQLYQSHGARMKSIALNLLRNVSDAEDAVQETFLKAYRRMGDFRGQSALYTWLFRILINSCRDIHRRRQRRGGETRELRAEEMPEPSAPSRDHPLRLALERAVAQLRPRHRTVFLLAEVEGFKHQEIAVILDISATASKNILFQAKRELREMLRRREKTVR